MVSRNSKLSFLVLFLALLNTLYGKVNETNIDTKTIEEIKQENEKLTDELINDIMYRFQDKELLKYRYAFSPINDKYKKYISEVIDKNKLKKIILSISNYLLINPYKTLDAIMKVHPLEISNFKYKDFFRKLNIKEMDIYADLYYLNRLLLNIGPNFKKYVSEKARKYDYEKKYGFNYLMVKAKHNSKLKRKNKVILNLYNSYKQNHLFDKRKNIKHLH